MATIRSVVQPRGDLGVAQPLGGQQPQLEILAVALDTGEVACRHPRSFARHRAIPALEHAPALRDQRAERRGEPIVEVSALDRYDQLIA